MHIEERTIIRPLPTDEYINKKERAWRVKLPTAFRKFVKQYSGGIPVERTFLCKEDNHEYAIDRFFCICPEYRTHELGDYDINVIWSQIGERLTDEPDSVGVTLLPIAVLFAGNFVCLDYKHTKDRPSVCVWDHEESPDFHPTTYYVADSFEEFCKLLTE